MTDAELKAAGWNEVGGLWLYVCDTGFTFQRAHTRDQAEHRTTKAKMTNKRLVDVWVLAPRTVEDGIAMKIVHLPWAGRAAGAGVGADAPTTEAKENSAIGYAAMTLFP